MTCEYHVLNMMRDSDICKQAVYREVLCPLGARHDEPNGGLRERGSCFGNTRNDSPSS